VEPSGAAPLREEIRRNLARLVAGCDADYGRVVVHDAGQRGVTVTCGLDDPLYDTLAEAATAVHNSPPAGVWGVSCATPAPCGG